jgi:hypothetical protein
MTNVDLKLANLSRPLNQNLIFQTHNRTHTNMYSKQIILIKVFCIDIFECYIFLHMVSPNDFVISIITILYKFGTLTLNY